MSTPNKFLLNLKRTEKILNLDINYFLRGSLFGFLQQFIGIFCGLGVNYLLGHVLSKSAYGEYNLVLSILGMLTFLSLPGIDTALIQSVGQGYEAALLQSTKLKLKFSLALLNESRALVSYSNARLRS